MPFAISFALAVSAALGNPAAADSAIPASMAAAPTVRQYVTDYFADAPIMASIAECESHFRQFNTDGGVYRGKENNQDVGVMQINEHYHLDTSKKMDIDIYTLDGNLAYARYLYEKEGTAPWASSQGCWGASKNSKLVATAAK